MWFCVEVASALFAGRQEEPAILNCRLLLRMHRCSDVGSFVKKELHPSKEICDHAGSDLLSLVMSSRVF